MSRNKSMGIGPCRARTSSSPASSSARHAYGYSGEDKPEKVLIVYKKAVPYSCDTCFFLETSRRQHFCRLLPVGQQHVVEDPGNQWCGEYKEIAAVLAWEAKA